MADLVPRSTSLLVICTANICRSPLAERVLRQSLADLPGWPELVVSSAGTRAAVGDLMCTVSAGELHDDATAVEHRSQPVSEEQVRRADLVLTMEREQRSAVVRLAPGSQAKVFTLREALGLLGVLQAGGEQRLDDLAALARALHSVRGLAELPAEPPKRRWWRRPVEPEDALTIDDGHGLDVETHLRAARSVRETAEAVAQGIRAIPGLSGPGAPG